MSGETIHNVSDTALWIAAFRAQESERKDALFKDVLAKKLAGERGYNMVETTPHKKAMAFAMVIRTVAIDKLVETAISIGIDTVINLGAGLDTRPYRMNLPSHLSWVEVDLPAIISYKNELLQDDKPNCKLQRIASDLSIDEEREQVFAKLGAQTAKALVITEGLIGYLSNEDAAKLSRSIYSIPSFQYWIQDYSQGKMRKHKRARNLKKKLVNAPLLFSENDPIRFFARDGWNIYKNIFILDQADSVGRNLPLMFPWNLLLRFSPRIRALGNKTYGYVMFGRS